MTDKLEEFIKEEKRFLDSQGTFKNEHGVYLFISEDGHQRIDLSFFLRTYRQWLTENIPFKEL